MMPLTIGLDTLSNQKIGISYNFSHYYAKIKVDSCECLPLDKLTLHNVIRFIKSVLNKDQNHHYYNIFSEKYSYQFSKK